MSSDTANDLIKAFEDLLARERQALLEGNLSAIEPLVAEKEVLLRRLSEAPKQALEEIEPIQAKLRRNRELFDQTLAGIRNVANRLAAARHIRQSMNVYTASGQKQTIAEESTNEMERRA